MQNSASTIVVIIVAGVLIIIVPLVTLTARIDNVTQANVQLIVDEFVIDITNTGLLTNDKYQAFVLALDSSGNNTYEIELEIQSLDENPGKKKAQINYTKIGENVYYSDFTTQILPQIGIKVNEDTPISGYVVELQPGDIISVKVKNTNPTSNQTLKSSFIGFSNAGEYAISASSSGMVTVNGVQD